MATSKLESSEWIEELWSALDKRNTIPPAALIEAISNISQKIDGKQADAYLDSLDSLSSIQKDVTKAYYSHIVEMETSEVKMLLQKPSHLGQRYIELASDRGKISYQRVADMFTQVDFRDCKRFVLIGAGQLPVTALHVMSETDVPEIVTVDISERAVKAVEELISHFGWNRLSPQLNAGHFFDYASADIIYLANMIAPKAAALEQVLKTARPTAKIIIREPYSLGQLWAEKIEDRLPSNLRIIGRGPISSHLSRDLYFKREET